jgi:hypothetical protein
MANALALLLCCISAVYGNITEPAGLFQGQRTLLIYDISVKVKVDLAAQPTMPLPLSTHTASLPCHRVGGVINAPLYTKEEVEVSSNWISGVVYV